MSEAPGDDYRYPTRFAESNALLAVQSKDLDVAREVLETLLDAELIELRSAAEDLSALCYQTWRNRQRRRRAQR